MPSWVSLSHLDKIPVTRVWSCWLSVSENEHFICSSCLQCLIQTTPCNNHTSAGQNHGSCSHNGYLG